MPDGESRQKLGNYGIYGCSSTSIVENFRIELKRSQVGFSSFFSTMVTAMEDVLVPSLALVSFKHSRVYGVRVGLHSCLTRSNYSRATRRRNQLSGRAFNKSLKDTPIV